MTTWMAEHNYLIGIVMGVVFGIGARISMLRTDYRQYPTSPHGKINHLSLGVIAAALGAVAVPSLLDKNYTAVTFLSLAAQQFRDVRNMERQTLMKIDSHELVPRGATYIEGIAMVFEGRNYLVILSAFVTSLFCIVFGWYWGVAAGICAILVANRLKSGHGVKHIATVEEAPVKLDGPNLFVGDIYMMNVGLEETQKLIAKHAIGLILSPKNPNCKVTLANLGQRQAILHDLSTVLGVYRDDGEPSLLPLAKLDMNDGRLALFLLPQQKDPGLARYVVHRVPVLESAVRMPTELEIKAEGEA